MNLGSPRERTVGETGQNMLRRAVWLEQPPGQVVPLPPQWLQLPGLRPPAQYEHSLTVPLQFSHVLPMDAMSFICTMATMKASCRAKMEPRVEGLRRVDLVRRKERLGMMRRIGLLLLLVAEEWRKSAPRIRPSAPCEVVITFAALLRTSTLFIPDKP